MMNTRKLQRLLGTGLLVVSLAACRHAFDVPSIPAPVRPLVVEGNILVGSDATTTIRLSRVQDVSRADSAWPELHAQVQLESASGTNYPLHEDSMGIYSVQHLNLSMNDNYRLNIATTNGNQYLTDFIKPKATPPIDSVTWEQNEAGDVTIYVNTHDPSDTTRYYRWEYEEAWNYVATLTTPWAVDNSTNMIYTKDPYTLTDSCWRFNNSTQIDLGNSQNLEKDVISRHIITVIPFNDERINVRYSILVKQYALTRDAYHFLQTLVKNTQQTGGIYDPQPSQLTTNVYCVNNPAEVDVGWVTSSTEQEMRLFIRKRDVRDQNWNFIETNLDCSTRIIGVDPNDFRIWNYSDTSYGPYYFTGGILVIAHKACMDCRAQGGVNVRPSFW